MTLKKRNSGGNAFFDFPAGAKADGKIITRRIAGIASRSLLSIRNLPVKPTQNEFSLKCFTNKNLYFFRAATARFLKFRTDLNLFLNLEKGEFWQTGRQLFKVPEIKPEKTRLAIKSQNQLEAATDSNVFFSFRKKIAAPQIRSIKLCRLQALEPDASFHQISRREINADIRYPIENLISRQTGAFTPLGTTAAVTNSFATAFPVIDLIRPDETPESFLLSLPEEISFDLAHQHHTTDNSGLFYHSLLKQPAKVFINPVLPEFQPSSFETRSEIGKNLILEAKTVTTCKIGVFAPVGSAGFIARLQTSKRSGINSTSPFPGHGLKLQFHLNFRNKPQSLLKAKNNLNLLERPFKAGSKNYPPATAFLAPAHEPARLRLRLRLKRADFSQRLPKMQLQNSYKARPVISGLEKLEALKNFRQKPAVVKESESQIRTTELLKSCKSLYFCRRRQPLFFLTRKHARYCFNLLKKVLRPALPFKAANLPISRQILAGTLQPAQADPAGFATSFGRFDDFVQLLGRANLFLMTVTDLQFTNISLPGHQRRLRAPKGLFLKSFDLSSPEKHRHWLNKFCCSDFARPVFKDFSSRKQKIFSRRQSFAIVLAPKAKENLVDDYKLSHFSIWRKYFNCFFRLEPRLSQPPWLPKAIVEQLPLQLVPLCSASEKFIEQKHIVPPPEWEKTKRSFACRLRLLPYPFGFPTFTLPLHFMKILQHNYRPRILDVYQKGLAAQGYNYSLNQRQFRSRFSLKNPQQWLFPCISRSISGFFKAGIKEMASPLDQNLRRPESPRTFAYSWQSQLKSIFKFLDSFRLAHKSEFKHPTRFEQHLGLKIENCLSPSLESAPIKTRRVNRLLIRQHQLNCSSFKESRISAPFQKIFLKSGFRPTSPDVAGSYEFAEIESVHNPEAKEILAFYFRFPPVSLNDIVEKAPYKALYRQFRFPYTPAFSEFSSFDSGFFELDDTSTIVAYAPGEEIRISQIQSHNHFESFSELPFCFMSRSVPSAQLTALHGFADEPRLAFYQRKPKNITPQPEPAVWQILNESKTRVQKLKFPVSRRVESCLSPSFSFMQTSLEKIAFTDSAKLRNTFGDLGMDSAHWVIMLKNFLGISTELESWQLRPNQTPTETDSFAAEINPDKSKFLPERSKPEFILSQPGIPLLFASHSVENSVSRHLPTTSTIATSKRQKIIWQDFSPVFAEPDSKLPDFAGRTDSPKVMTPAATSAETIKTLETSEIRFVEFKMQHIVERIPAPTKAYTKKIRPRRSGFRLPCLPDWVDMEMQHVDLNLQRN